MPLKPNAGRALSAAGAVLAVLAFFLVWYHIDRTQGPTDTTGWQTFTRLRWAVLAAAILTFASVIPAQRGVVLAARTLLGLLVAALVLRRIVDPPALDAAIHDRAGVYVGLLGAIMVAAGGLVDSGREVLAHPALPFRSTPVAELPPGDGNSPSAPLR